MTTPTEHPEKNNGRSYLVMAEAMSREWAVRLMEENFSLRQVIECQQIQLVIIAEMVTECAENHWQNMRNTLLAIHDMATDMEELSDENQ